MNTNCNGWLTSAGVKGCTLDPTMATIITVSMTNARSTSSAMTAVAATTSMTTRRVSPSARTKASSPDAYTASTPITCMMSAVLIRTTKRVNNNNKCKHKKNGKRQSHCDTYPMRHMHNNRWTSSKSSRLAEPVTPSLVTKDKPEQ
jgi:hypothetical protein